VKAANADNIRDLTGRRATEWAARDLEDLF
jgi:hypothetical protein